MVIVNLLNQYLVVKSNTIILLALKLIKQLNNEYLKIIHKQSFIHLIQLIKNDNKEIRNHLTEVLEMIYKAISE
jgi:hypothetical protein